MTDRMSFLTRCASFSDSAADLLDTQAMPLSYERLWRRRALAVVTGTLLTTVAWAGPRA